MYVQGQSQDWRFGMPFTCRFQVTNPGTPTANNAHFMIYNLPEKMRNDILADVTDNMAYRGLVFSAGYESEPSAPPTVFIGNVYWAYSYRQGPDWITEIDALDGGFGLERGSISYSAKAGTPWGTILRAVIGMMPNLKIGFISDRLDLPDNVRGISIAEPAWSWLIKILPARARLFIAEEKVYILADRESRPDEGWLKEISDDTGLIGSPRRQQMFTIATLVFEPRIKIYQKLTLKSAWAYAGDHLVMRIEHHGTISPAVSDEAVTIVHFLRGPGEILEAAQPRRVEAAA